MNKRKKKSRIIALLLAMAGGLVSPPTATAQYNGDRGLFGRSGTRDNSEFSSGVFNQGFGNTSGSLLGNQGFGGTDAGMGNQGFGGTNGGITNQGFAVPIGSGLLVLAAAGAGYTTIKRNKKNKKLNQQNRD